MKIGIDLGGTNIRVGVVSNGRLVRSITEPTNAHLPEEEVLARLKAAIRKLMSPEIQGIGIGVPSVVDAQRGIVYNVANIPSWKEVHLKEVLIEEFQIPVAVNNDCNCFALGEHHFGEGRKYKDLVCVALGTGVGAGLILEGQLFIGSNTGAGEIGCLPYLSHTFEYYCGSTFFSDIHRITGKDAYEKASQGDEETLRMWEEIGGHIGELVKAILFTYDPQAVIFGGSISKGYAFFESRMLESMQDFPYPETIRRLQVGTSQIENIALLGASVLI